MARFVAAPVQTWQPSDYVFGPYNVPANIDSIDVFLLPDAAWVTHMRNATVAGSHPGGDLLSVAGLPAGLLVPKGARVLLTRSDGGTLANFLRADAQIDGAGFGVLPLYAAVDPLLIEPGAAIRVSRSVIEFTAEQSPDNGQTWQNWGGSVFATGPLPRSGTLSWGVTSGNARNRARVSMIVRGDPVTFGLDADLSKRLN